MKEQLLRYLEATRTEQLQLLEKLVLQSSHSMDKIGVDRVGAMIREELFPCDLQLSVDHQDEYGDNLVFSSAACASLPAHLLLVGHMDTVFPRDSSFNFYREDHIKAYGPGVCDMKGGLVTAIFLVKALHSCRLLKNIPLVFICNSDEEIGSPGSTALITRHARRSLCGLVFECGGTEGEVATGRKGKAGFKLHILGKSGHAAFSQKTGKSSAILELAHKVIEVEKLNNPRKNIVVNVGRISGGAAANVIAENASAEIDIRFVTDDDGQFCLKSLQAIASQSTVSGTTGSLVPTNSRLPMMQTDDNLTLYYFFKKSAEQLGIPIKSELRSGVSDANTIAACGIPVIDGLGPIGALDHSENEYILKDSLLQRCKLATLTTLEIWHHFSRTNVLTEPS
ncbi:MAG: M20 family metallopeptidase [Desulfopila sp.]|jgi:glutamate carboxypeptidase|nr:M20 family metallopeptidase [Desulfopila sp.]